MTGGESVTLVIGAGGKVGTVAVRRLVEYGVPVRALRRDPAGAAPGDGAVELVQGDLDRPETLPPAFAGADRVLLVAAGADIPAEEAAAIAAAEQAGVKHFVLLSSLGVDAGVASGPAHAPGEARLRASGIPWTILRPGFFMANAMMWRDTILAEGVVYEPTGAGRHAMVHPADVGEVAAEVLCSPGHEGRIYELTGPEPVSTADCAAALSAVTGRDIHHVDIPDQAFRDGMTRAGAPPALVDSLARYYAMVKAGQFETVTPVVAEMLGRPARTFGMWAEESAGAFV